MKKTNKNIWKNLLLSHKGSILSTLIAFSIMGVSTVGLLQYMVNFKTNMNSSIEGRENENLISQLAINQLKSILVEKNIDQNGKQSSRNTYGICSLVEKTKNYSGVELVKLNFGYIKKWNTSRWKVFFPEPEWKLVDAAKCQKLGHSSANSILKRCIEYHGGQKITADHVYVMAEISPRVFPKAKKKIGLNSSNRLDPKEVIFLLSVTVASYYAPQSGSSDKKPKKDTYFYNMSDMVWAGDVGECHVKAKTGDWVIVQFSGVGLGASIEKLVINDSLYEDQKMCKNMVKVLDLNSDVVQAGQLRNSSLQSIAALNAKISCTTNTFRCRQNGQIPNFKDEEIDDLQFRFGLINSTSNPVHIKRLNLTFTKNGKEVDNTANSQLDNVDIDLYSSRDNNTPFIKANTELQRNKFLFQGEEILTAQANMDNHCRSICQNSDVNIYPMVNVELHRNVQCEFTKDFSENEDNKISCTVCFMKSCHRMGLGTFGPAHSQSISLMRLRNAQAKEQQIIQGLPDEPLDAQLPECHIADNASGSSSAVRQLLPSIKNQKSSNSSPGCHGFSVEIKDLNTFKDLWGAKYSVEACSKKRPVLCFINGYYVPAMKINTSGNQPVSLVTTTFDKADQACYKIGREVGTLSNLGSLFKPGYPQDLLTTNTMRALPTFNNADSSRFTLLTVSDIKFDFINNAARGIFLAPMNRTYSHIPNGKINQIMDTVLGQKMWVAMEWDGGGIPVASVPWGLVAKEEPYALFFNKDVRAANRPVLMKDTQNFNNSKYLALAYGVRWKGVVPFNAQKELPVICQNKSTKQFFISKSQGKVKQAQNICGQENGVFFPPESGYDWAQLMLQLNPHDAHYPFPDPNIPQVTDTSNGLPAGNNYIYKVQDNAKLAWVGLKLLSSGSSSVISPGARGFRLYADHLSASSVFRKGSVSPNVAGVNQRGVEVNITSDLFKSNSFNKFQYKVICVNSNTRLPVSVAGIGACSGSAVETAIRLKSFRYMAELFRVLSGTSFGSKDVLVLNHSVYSHLKAEYNRKYAAWLEAERKRKERERLERLERERLEREKKKKQQQQP